jgi:LmbE family N-acetylglucosaminyl deacetylase
MRVVPHTLVTFHAHPDDEALLTAGTMARAAAEGHRVVLVVATAGEGGEVASDFLAADEQLGGRRMQELAASAAALGVHRVELLGYRDSGLGEGSGGPGTFCAASVDEAAERLAGLLREEQADVLTTYDRNGGYGHPDHRMVHAVGHRAAQLAGTPVVLEATVNRDVLRGGVDVARSLGYEIPADFSPEVFDDWFLPDDEITTYVDVSAHLAAKRAAMEAHASQATTGTPATGASPLAAVADGSNLRTLAAFLALPEPVYALAFGTEWFVRRGAEPGTREVDVFAALVPPGAVP